MVTPDPKNPPPCFVDDFEVRWIGRAMRRHGVLVLIAVAIGALTGAGLSVFSTPMYRAEAVLLVNIQSVRVGADGVPMDVELIPPARRTVGTICQSDAVMMILNARLEGGLDPMWPTPDELSLMVDGNGHKAARTRLVRYLNKEIYFDQRSQEMAALRAVDSDPVEAARIANTWAEVSREMLVRAYGTMPEELEQTQERIEQARQEVLAAKRAVDQSPPQSTDPLQLERADHLDRARLVLTALNQRFAQLTVRLENSQQIVRVVSQAAPPAEPINPSARLVVGLFTLAGLLVGFTLALLRGPGPLQ